MNFIYIYIYISGSHAMNGENGPLVTDEPVEFEKSLTGWISSRLQENYPSFRGICGICLELLKRKPGRSQHVTGWTWKHKDLDRFCSKISLDTDHMATCRTFKSWQCPYPKNFMKPYTEQILICLWTSLIWGLFGIFANEFRFHKHRIHLSVIQF